MENHDDNEDFDNSHLDENWENYEDQDERDIDRRIRYLDLTSLRVQDVGQRILDSALESAKNREFELNSLWEIFVDHIRDHIFAEEVSNQIQKINHL